MDKILLSAFVALALLAPAAGAQDVKALERDLSAYEFGTIRKGVDGLLAIGSLEAGQALARGLGNEQVYTRDYVFEQWAKAKPSDDVVQWILAQGLADENVRVRRNLVELLAVWKVKEAARVLTVVLGRDRDVGVRAEAAWALGALGATEAYEALDRRVRTNEWLEKVAVLEAMAALDWARAKADVEKARSDRNGFVHTGALVLLAEKDPAAGLAAAIEDVKDPGWQVRAAAIDVLSRSKENAAVQPLIDRLKTEAGRLKHDAWVALQRLTGKLMPDNAEMWQGWWDRAKDTFDARAVQPAVPGQPANGGDGGSTVTYYGIVVYSTRVAFTLDCSGSMEDPVAGGKTKLGVAKEELISTLKQFKPGMYFNLVFFPTVIQPWKDRLQPATPGNLAAAAKFIETRKASDNPGGNRGNMYDALVHTMLDPATDTVFVLSDGRPSAGEYQFSDRFMPKFLRLNRYARMEVHTIVVGQGRMDKEFMVDLAGSTGGQHVSR